MTEEIKPQLTAVEKAELLVKQLEEQTKKYEELVDRQEKARVQDLLGGKGEAGIQQTKPKRKLTEKEYAQAFMQGKVRLNEPEPEVDA